MTAENAPNKAALVIGGTGEATVKGSVTRVRRLFLREQWKGDFAARKVSAVSYVRVDMDDFDSARMVVDAAVSTLGHLDEIVHTSGATAKINHADLGAVDDALWKRILGSNILAPWRTVLAA